MATQTTFSVYTQSLATLMSTDLNALANGSAILGTVAVIDNTTNLDLWADFQLDVDFVSAPTANTTVDLYLLPSLDGTNYATGTATLVQYFAGSFPMTATTAAFVASLMRVPLIPGKLKPYLVNGSGQAFPATGTTVKYRSYHVTNT